MVVKSYIFSRSICIRIFFIAHYFCSGLQVLNSNDLNYRLFVLCLLPNDIKLQIKSMLNEIVDYVFVYLTLIKHNERYSSC